MRCGSAAYSASSIFCRSSFFRVVITFRPVGEELVCLQRAAGHLKAANAALAEAKKAADAAKRVIEDWLLRERKISLEGLGIGELVHVEEVVLIEVGKQNKFDEKGFLAAHPGLHGEFKRDFAVIRWRPVGK